MVAPKPRASAPRRAPPPTTQDALGEFEACPSPAAAARALAAAAAEGCDEAPDLSREAYLRMHETISGALLRGERALAGAGRRERDWDTDSGGRGRMSAQALLRMMQSLVARWGEVEARALGVNAPEAELIFAGRLVSTVIGRDPWTGRPRLRPASDVAQGAALPRPPPSPPPPPDRRCSRNDPRHRSRGSGFRASARRAIAMCGGLEAVHVPRPASR